MVLERGVGMKAILGIVATIVFTTTIHLYVDNASAATKYMCETPGYGQLPTGMVVYADNGRCPPGQVRRYVGGSIEKGIDRQKSCVKRPRGMPKC